MKIHRKNIGLLLVSLIALSFNSHFAQAAKKTADIIRPSKVYAYKLAGDAYAPIPQVKASSLVVKKTGIRLDRNNLYIGGYIVNSSDKPVAHVRVYPTFKTQFAQAAKLTDLLNHDEMHLGAGEVRRFVIMRPINDVKDLLENNIPLTENCILNCRTM